MIFRCTLFSLILLPTIAFSQSYSKKDTNPGRKIKTQRAGNYYLKKEIDLSPDFSVQYASLFSGLQGYKKKDTLLATKIISRLYQFNNILFYRLMRIRLEWEFKQHLQQAPLDSTLPLIETNADSAKCYYMQGIYFEDSMYERTARKFGYVKVNYHGDEVVDWRKMRTLRFGDPRLWEQITHTDGSFIKKDSIKDLAIAYYKKAVELDKDEFYYLKTLLIYLFIIGDEADLQQTIISKLDNYTSKERKWLRKRLALSYQRQNNQ